MARSITIAKGTGHSDLMHNTREHIAENVDPARIKNNVILKRETLQEAYENCFGAAQAEYNAKQKRSDRKINDYFENLFGVSASDKQQTRNTLINKHKNQSYYENLVQIGDMFDTHCVNDPKAAGLAKQALTAYFNGDTRLGIKSYAERNPQFYVFDATVHMDESTPHLHLCYVPVATGYKRGLAVQNGHDKALKQMNYETNVDYILQEREIFREICKSYGLDPKAREAEQSRGHTYSTREYRQNAEQIRKVDAERLMPAVAPTEPATAPTMSYRSHKQSGKKAPVEAPTKPVEHTGFTRFNYSEAKQKIREEMQLEQRIAEAQNLYDDQSDGYDKDIAE